MRHCRYIERRLALHEVLEDNRSEIKKEVKERAQFLKKKEEAAAAAKRKVDEEWMKMRRRRMYWWQRQGQ